jgi:hypothetical protein
MKLKICFRLLLSAMVLIIPLSIIACSDSGGSNSVEPFLDEPMIVDSAMCINVDQDRPDGITSKFYSSDDRIYIWLYWTNMDTSATVKTVWYDPNEKTPYREDSQIVRSDSGYAITWFYMDKPIKGFTTGEWSVEVYLDGQFERSYLFTVN